MPMPIKADELFQAWSRQHWQSLYLFAGQEDFLIEQAVHQAMAHWLQADDSGLNRDRFDADNHSAEEIIQVVQTVPFFATTRVIQIDNASRFSASDQERLAESLSRLPPETRMIFIWGKEWRRDDSRKPLVEAVSRLGQVIIFWPLFPEPAQRWVVQRAKTLYAKTLAPDAAAWLVQHAGEGLRLLDQEIAKCTAYVGEKPGISLEDLQASFGYQKASSPFDWVTALRQKHHRPALQVLRHLLQEGEEPLHLLALVERALRDWLSAKASGENPSVLAMRFHIRRGEENRFSQELMLWDETELTMGLQRCVETEQRIKTGKETPEMALTLLTLSLCSLQTADAPG
ncbi:MAG: DNA polymerase III subunit delta [Elusimicrobiota bacterium]|jgi:DNA polymerase-3 subunit delta